MTAAQWAMIATDELKPGRCYIYHEGYLARDRTIYREVNSLANALWTSYRQGKVELTQRRLGSCEYQYIAIGRK